ncbi:MAG: hypothetical protein Q8O29_03780 [Polaromonas sp.]|uniref:hypothetical protein n=1 Tax=Polaromonas sp. TaxID=1869339 RepID=UPI002735DD22|nr:hypothetical protein [Polaromonas sp.]MDP2817396.1 hypothetical protein [Polaromonas sp.]
MERVARFAVLHGSRRRAIAALSAVSVGDFFVPALPTQTSVLALGLMQPQRAAWIALAFATAAALGAALLALLLSAVGGYAQQFGAEQFGADWTRITGRVQVLGLWAVFAASIFPTPPRLLTAATLLAGAAVPAVVAAVFAGKLIWFALFLGLLIKAPAVLARLPVLSGALLRFRAFQAAVLAGDRGDNS